MVAGLKFQLRKQKKVFFKKVFQIFLSPRQDTHGQQKERKGGIPLACWSETTKTGSSSRRRRLKETSTISVSSE
jgi:hypothetical protein